MGSTTSALGGCYESTISLYLSNPTDLSGTLSLDTYQTAMLLPKINMAPNRGMNCLPMMGKTTSSG